MQIDHRRKERQIPALIERHGTPITTVVETGILHGEMTAYLATIFRTVYAVDLSPEFCEAARKRFMDNPGVIVREGDSKKVTPLLADALNEPVFWYLDAHALPEKKGSHKPYPGSATGSFPLWEELSAIARRPYADLVYVDDKHTFGKDRPDLAGLIDKDDTDGSKSWAGVTPDTLVTPFKDRIAWTDLKTLDGFLISLDGQGRQDDQDDEDRAQRGT